MAYETVKYACGHTEEKQFYGKMDDRRRRVAAMEQDDCPACRAAGSDLIGSDKQIAWAEDTRPVATAKTRENLDAFIAEVEAQEKGTAEMKETCIKAAKECFDAWAGEKRASVWIDRKQSAGLTRYDFMQAGRAALQKK